MLAGSSQTIDVDKPGDVEGVSVRSSNESVAEFAVERECQCERDDFDGTLDIENSASCPSPWLKRCDNRILVQTHGPGRATLAMFSSGNVPLDQVEIDVRAADHIALWVTRSDSLGQERASEQDVSVGGKLEVEAAIYARDGLELLAVDGVDWESSDSDVAVVSAFLLGRGAEIEAGKSATVEALAEGEAVIRVQTPSASAELALSVEP
jgi:hypothetical protein